jgi:hypothetical protein
MKLHWAAQTRVLGESATHLIQTLPFRVALDQNRRADSQL